MRRNASPVLVLAVSLFGLGGLSAAATAQDAGVYRGLVPVVKFDISPPLRDIVPIPPREGPILDRTEGLRDEDLFKVLGPQEADGALQSVYGSGEIPAPGVSFDGPPNISSVSPPDPVGDVGPNHYVAMSNLSLQIFDKTGVSLVGPVANNTLWAGFGGDCETDNDGDPIVLHDQIADRWMLSQFTASGPTFFNCVAISTTPDPTGTYFRYAFGTGTNFPDYPKYGWWSDALYISTREFAGSSFAGVGAYAIKRADLIAGSPTPQMISFIVPPGATAYNVGDGLLPADLDGFTLPPGGSPEYFVGSMDNGGPYGAPQDALNIWEFAADFTTPANSTFVLAHVVPISAYDTQPAFCSGRSCVPQPGTANKLDHLGYRQRPMHRLGYRNMGTHESLVTNQSVEASATMSGIRWWEIRSPGSSPVLFQEGTYAPGISDGIHRWMGSIAMDSAGNMALGYSASDGTSTFPSSFYTGRLAGDPLGTMPQGEESIVDGTGSQTGSQRWGDYTSMNVDPVDDCTFWYVNEYVPTTSSVGWRLRIGSFRFNECGTPDYILGVTPASVAVCAGTDAIYTVNVGQIAGYTDPVTLGTSGTPAGAVPGYGTNPVAPPGVSTLTVGTGAVAAGSYSFDVTGNSTSGAKSVPVGLDVYVGAPGAPTLVAPADGAVDLPLKPSFSWTPSATASAYNLEIATDAAFSNIVVNAPALPVTTYQPAVNLVPNTTYYWRVFGTNVCGNSSASAVFNFTTGIPRVLLVDDDNNDPDVLPTYQALLTTMSINAEVWDTTSSEPALGDLLNYEAIVWFSGDKFCSATSPCAGPQTAA
ncbi:MAG: fibronectin type III domain-containing protein, partial [Acidobacteria bacterium]|nr:fibronectin type III domain-containing protein [Acidobacteriota bacterium]